MKDKKEILKMNKEELSNYKWSDDLDKIKENKNCSNCTNCTNCSNCLYCRNLKYKRDGYYICNVEVTKKEFEKKKKELLK